MVLLESLHEIRTSAGGNYGQFSNRIFAFTFKFVFIYIQVPGGSSSSSSSSISSSSPHVESRHACAPKRLDEELIAQRSCATMPWLKARLSGIARILA